jgi:hypothetical protein
VVYHRGCDIVRCASLVCVGSPGCAVHGAGNWAFTGNGDRFLEFLFAIAGQLSALAACCFHHRVAVGLAARSYPGLTFEHSLEYAVFTWPDFVLLTLGAVVTAVLLVRKPDQKPFVSSIALAYGLYLPIGVAGFGMTSGIPGFWPDGLTIFAIHLGWAALVGTITLLVMGLAPF